MLVSGFETADSLNVLSGTFIEFLKRPSRVSVGLISGSVLGTDLRFSFQIGSTKVANDERIFGNVLNVAGGTVLAPRFPDDFGIKDEPGLPGDRMILAINLSGGSARWIVMVTEVG